MTETNNDDPLTEETARKMTAAMIMWAAASNKQSEEDAYKQWERIYNRVFGH